MPRFFMLLLSVVCFVQSVCYAEEATDIQITGDDVIAEEAAQTSKTVKVQKLNFSTELLQAAEGCLPYSEDFTSNNNDLTQVLQNFASEMKLQINVKILGMENGMCHFQVEQNVLLNGDLQDGSSVSDCYVSEEQKNDLLYAMKDQSGDVYTDVIQSNITDENGVVVGTQEQTVTGSQFDVLYANVMVNKCSSTDKSPNQVEKELSHEEYVEQYNLFSPSFIKSLQLCKPDSEEHRILLFERKIEITGRDNDICHLAYEGFDLSVPMEVIPNIHGFDDINVLLKNKDMAHYNYSPEYIYDGLVHAFNSCYNKHDYHGLEETKMDGNIKILRGLTAQYEDKACVIYLTNEVKIEDNVLDYSVMCRLTDETMEELMPKFADVLQKYGERRQFNNRGFVVMSQAQENSETKDADIALMYYMQQKEYCKKPNL